MTELLTRNLGWKLFALAISLLLWITFAGSPEMGAFINVPLEFKGMPDHLEIASEAVDLVALDVRGTADRLRDFSKNPSGILLDFSGIEKPGEHTFQIGPTNVSLPQGLRLVRAIPAQVRFQFEERTMRYVPVQVRFSMPVPQGYVLRRHTVDPATILIVGPASRVQRVENAATDSIDLSAVVGDTLFRVNTFADDSQVRTAGEGKVSVKVFVEKE